MIDQITSADLDRLAEMLSQRQAEDPVDTVLIPQDLETAYRDGVQETLHILSAAMLLASTEVVLPDTKGRTAPLNLHTVEALFLAVQNRTGVPYSGARKRRA